MQIEKRLNNHYRRWNIDLTYEEEFLKFKNRLIRILDKFLGSYLISHSGVDKRFFEIFKLHEADTPEVKRSRLLPSLIDRQLSNLRKEAQGFRATEEGFGDTSVYKYVSQCENSQQLATVLQILFWVLEEQHHETQHKISEIIQEIRKISVLTPSASFKVHRKGEQIIIYPSGDQFLDEGIVDFVLSGLEDYPDTGKAFERALKIYQRGEASQYRNLLDDLRFALEQLLQKVLNSKSSLENQKEKCLQWLNSQGLHVQIVNLYQTLLSQFVQYQNNAVKHGENFSVDEVEFMIYLTGNFMRLILQLARQVDDAK